MFGKASRLVVSSLVFLSVFTAAFVAPGNGLPQSLKGAQEGRIISSCYGIEVGSYGWDFLRDRSGDGYGEYDGPVTFGPELTLGHDIAAVFRAGSAAWLGADVNDRIVG